MRPHVFLIIAVAWNHVIHGEETNPSLQEANHENVTNSSVIAEKRVARSDLGGQGESEENPPPFWANRGRSLNPRHDSNNLERDNTYFQDEEPFRQHKHFFVDEPEWLVVEEAPTPEENDGHEECGESRKRRTSHLNAVDEAFWPSRGRRSEDKRSTDHGENAGSGTQDLAGLAKMFHSTKGNFNNAKVSSKSHGEHSRFINMPSIEEPFWAARGRSLLTEPSNHRSRLMKSLQEPFWATYGRRPGNSARARRSETTSGEEPFWAARGRRSHNPGAKRPEQFSGEEPFWAARGRRFDHTQKIRRSQISSGEEPFWAARGRRTEFGVHDSDSGKILSQDTHNRFAEFANLLRPTEKLISEMGRGRRSPHQREHHLQFSSMEEPFWAARGKREFLKPASAEEPFWAARGKKQLPQTNYWNAEWWPIREAAAAVAAEDNPEDESFWTALESKLSARRYDYMI